MSILALSLRLGNVSPDALHAQTAPSAVAAQNIADMWQGTLQVGEDLRTAVKISKGTDGTLQAQWYSIDQTPRPLPIKATTIRDGELRLSVEDIDGVYIGKLSPDGSTIVGEWKQGGQTFPLILARATKETMRAIPEPPEAVAPMAADADPSWEVATIKPAAPGAKGKGFGGAPRQFKTLNTTLNDIVMFAYDVNSKQIVGGPAWMETDKFDITTGEPDQPGAPSKRHGLKFHPGKKDISAYVLTVAKGDRKMTKNKTDDHHGSSFYFTKLSNLVFRDDMIDDFCHGTQGAVLDRPVVNHTGLEGHWDGLLKWTPEETQFQILGVKIVPDESPDAPPILTAIQEKIGLKLYAEKTAVDVTILDHTEKSSDN